MQSVSPDSGNLFDHHERKEHLAVNGRAAMHPGKGHNLDC